MRYTMKMLMLVVAVLPCYATARASAPPSPALRVVTDNNFPPYVYSNRSGKLVGYEVDLWRLWQQKTGRKVNLVGTDWADAQARIHDGRADVIDMIYRTPERAKTLEFSPSFATSKVSVFSIGTITGIDGPDALHGFQVGVERGDACAEHLRAKGIDNLKLYPDYAQLI